MGDYESYFGSYEEDDRRYSVWLALRVEPVQTAIKLTTTHQSIPEGSVEIAISGSVYDVTGRKDTARSESRWVSGGQVVDSLRKVAGRERLAELWDTWHLNGMTAACEHQGETWTCTYDFNAKDREIAKRIGNDPASVEPAICGTLNGWPEIRRLFGEHPYPQRGDTCHKCGRNRWDEPSDRCPVSDYRYGTAWLYRVPPPEIVDELRRTFGQAVPA